MAILLATIAYNKPEFVREGLQFFRDNSDKSEYDRHVVFDPGYPVGGVEENRAEIKKIAKEFGLEYVPMNNVGCHQNFQTAMKYMRTSQDDYFAPVCPDARGRNKGWVKACADVLKADRDCFTVQLNREINYGPYGAQTKVIGGHEVLYFPALVSWSVGMFSCRLLDMIGGFKADSERYGFCEHAMARELGAFGKHWYLIKNYYDNCAGSPDPQYLQWKQESAAKKTILSFEDWLSSKR